MNANQPNAVPANQPTVVQQTTVIQVGSHKSVGGAVALAFFLGPLGMLYATVPGAFLMFFINVLVLIWTAGIGLLLTIPLGMIWAGAAASSHNKGMGIATQAIAAPARTESGWLAPRSRRQRSSPLLGRPTLDRALLRGSERQ